MISPCFEGCVESLDQRWGPRATDEVWWRDSNPTDLAPNLGGVTLFTRAATGDPCDAEDVADGAQSDATAFYAERPANEQTVHFRRALDLEDIPHDSATYECGIHTYRHFRRALRDFLPWVVTKFGALPARRFSFRSAASRFTAWDWTFTASRERAPEFLDLRDASRKGFAVTGTGPVEVLTAPCSGRTSASS